MQELPSKTSKRKAKLSADHPKKKRKLENDITQTTVMVAKVPKSPSVVAAKSTKSPPIVGAKSTKSPPVGPVKRPKPSVVPQEPTEMELADRYPILKDVALVNQFLSVSMTNNQKGRIRQTLKDSLKGTSESLLPDVIHDRIKSILKASKNLNEPELRKLRILYNMLKTAAKSVPLDVKKEKVLQPIMKKKETEDDGKTKVQKVKGPKRYVVFLGNLPLGIRKEKIMQHFSDLGDHIKSLRIPKQGEPRNSAIAYLEVANEHSFELALSKNHSMLENRRINVLYTTQSKSKISKSEAKGKSAKLLAMQKTGKLLGSVPLNRKRSARRKKMKEAQKKSAQEAE